ncbi:hypothetical protein D5R40_33930 [Okeania hirsuta]|uniref:Uncharacterized protein n=1 Tax=Okeania hirsuta TaxID=1458930 RepID=A0A3N6PMX9_9CYAN|nr:hypothetical protein D5R40_33930 [Okeania hirsuta]
MQNVYGDKIEQKMLMEAGYVYEDDIWWLPVASILRLTKLSLANQISDPFGYGTQLFTMLGNF